MARKKKIHRNYKYSNGRRTTRRRTRRSSGYSSRRKKGSAVKTVLFVLLVIGLIFGAYYAAGPIMRAITGNQGTSSHTSSLTGSADASSQGGSSEPATSSQPVQSGLSGKTAVMPAANLTNLDKVKSFAASAKQAGASAVLVELKNETGELLYNSGSERAKKYRAVKNKNVSLKAVADAIKGEGLTPVAQLHMLKDKTAANRTNNNTYMIKGENSTWWDNSPSSGGKPWLNPYQEEAVAYLLGLEAEVMDAGFTQVVLASVQYPDVRNTSIIDFPDGASKTTHQQKLKELIQKSQELAEQKKCAVTVSYNTLSILGKKDNIYFGNPLNLEAKTVSPILQISQLGNSLKVGENTINPKEHPEQAVRTVLDAIRAKSPDAQIVPILAKDAQTPAVEQALQAAGIKQWIVQ